nr:FERM domain-containing protein 5-like [Leptinotarsa decemlineata]
MKTVVSKTGVEVIYPCSVHLLANGEILECEYKSDNVGRDLIDYICDQLNIQEKDIWGLRFVDTFEQRHWLDLNKLIRPQVKNVCPIHFHFRMKVYPPEPYKLLDLETKFQIFMQLKLDLMSGRLCCGPSDSSLFVALILQYTYGDFDPERHSGNYIKEKIIMNQSFAGEMKAIDLHKHHLRSLNPTQIMDLFLRMACQLETYGVDPHLVENLNHQKFNLWINYKGMVTYVEGKKNQHIDWMNINKIQQEDNKLMVHLCSGGTETFFSLTKPECNYIYQSAVDHLIYFTTSGTQSTVGHIGNDSMEELHKDLKVFEKLENSGNVASESTKRQEKSKYGVSRISKFHSPLCQFYVTALMVFAIGVAIELYIAFGYNSLKHYIMKIHRKLIEKYFWNKLSKIF